jgi:integrase
MLKLAADENLNNDILRGLRRMGMRANEIVSRVVRDLDDDGKLLWIPDSKTEAGRRTLQVPELLRPLLKALAEGKSPDAKLFGYHWLDWVRKWVKRICDAAGVPKVTAHGCAGCIRRWPWRTACPLTCSRPRSVTSRSPRRSRAT